MAGSPHKTYALLRYVPTYWDLPAPAIPALIVLGAVCVAVFGISGLLVGAGLTVATRVAYQWNRDVFAIVRAAIATLPFLDRHGRLRT